jgi:predicted GNAT family acetyltransferase
MHITVYPTAPEFLRDVRPSLEAHEAADGLMLGLAIRLVDEPLAYGDPPYLAAVINGRRLILAALMTPPHNLILSSELEDAAEALDLLASDLEERSWAVPGTLGPERLVEAFADRWTHRTGLVARPGMRQRIYELRRVSHPRYSPGRLRPATAEEAGLIAAWMEAFQDEAVPGSARTTPETFIRRVAEGSVFVWDDGGPVCVAMKTRPTQHGVSVGGVYTPPELRRRGYATSCVAALSQRLLDAGFEYCTLFTDLSNPTSNDIYQQIGYRPVCDVRQIGFVAETGASQ